MRIVRRSDRTMRQNVGMDQAKRALAAMRGFAPVCAFNNARILSRSLERIYDDIFRTAGLSASQVALLWAILVTEPISSKDIARFTQTDQTTVSRVVARANALGLIDIATSARDKRQKDISLSALGRMRLAAVLPLWKKAQREVRALFDPQALQRLVRPLKQGERATRLRRRPVANSAPEQGERVFAAGRAAGSRPSERVAGEAVSRRYSAAAARAARPVRRSPP